MKKALYNFFSTIIADPRLFASFIILLSVGLSLHQYFRFPAPGTMDYTYHYTHYNDYMMFRHSFIHLLHHKSLYAGYPYEYYDQFKYTPTFAVLMAPFAILPNIAGLACWTALNAFILFFALRRFPYANPSQILFVVGFTLIEAITALQAFECNCLLAGLFIWAFIAMERKNIALATLLLMLTVFIKPFGIAFFALFIFYPDKIKTILFSLLWFVILLFLPLTLISLRELFGTYSEWGNMLLNDHTQSCGFSVMGILCKWFGLDLKFTPLLIGIALLLLPLMRYKKYSNETFRSLFFSSLLIWVVIFNHLAESPTYVIAISGVALWFTRARSKTNLVLLIICFLFSVLASTDIYPEAFRYKVMIPYVVKTVPCVIIWGKIIFELLTRKFPAEGKAIPA